MKTFSAVTLLAAASGVVATKVAYDPVYTNEGASMNTVSCSGGENGLITKKGWQTYGDIPTSYFGGAWDIVYNSPNCGSCYQVDYNGKTIYVLGIDHVNEGLNINEDGLNALTNNNAKNLNVIDATVNKVDPSHCLS